MRRYEESVLEVMVANGVTLDEAMQPPAVPTPHPRLEKHANREWDHEKGRPKQL